eukprot:scaffold65398_cov28-Prasinocladus_malaysianus.AAC.1
MASRADAVFLGRNFRRLTYRSRHSWPRWYACCIPKTVSSPYPMGHSDRSQVCFWIGDLAPCLWRIETEMRCMPPLWVWPLP